MHSKSLLIVLALAPCLAFANVAPEGRPDRYVIRAGESLDVRAPGVLQNDLDADGDHLFLEPAKDATAGQLILFPNGSFSYTPDARFTGSDRFTYQACDNIACSEPVEVRIESDGIAAPLSTRPDRFEIPVGQAVLELDVLANDVFELERLKGGRLEVTQTPLLGDISIAAAPEGAASPFLLRYLPRVGAVGVDRIRYRICEAAARCAEADVEVSLLPFGPIALNVSTAAGFSDIPLVGLPELTSPDLFVTAFGTPSTYRLPMSIDATPNEAWAGGGAGEMLFRLDGGESGRQVRLRVRLTASGDDVDLYLGRDDDRNLRASSDEVRCISARRGDGEDCTIEIIAAAGEVEAWWVLGHNRGGNRAEGKLTVLETEVVNAAPLKWTAPGRLEANGRANLRLSWTDFLLSQGEAREGWARLDSGPGVELGWVPIEVASPDAIVAPRLLRHGDSVSFDLEAQSAADILVLDVPNGTERFEVSAAAEGGFELALFRAPPPQDDIDDVRFPTLATNAEPEAVAESSEGIALLPVTNQPAGRWYARVRAFEGSLSSVNVEARLTPRSDAEQALAPGFYSPSQRPGHGLMVDRVGSDWSGVWYAFDESGASTWLYLQGPEPEAGTAWNPTVYRSAKGDTGTRLVAVGRASLGVIEGDSLWFSFEVDGLAGSQVLADFGRGCPVHRGESRDLSGLWYDPAFSGEGYGVWITPNYELYALFTHDARGVPRYLAAEGSGFAILGDRELAFMAYRGACVFCSARTRQGEAVGSFWRLFAPSLTPILTSMDASFGLGVLGSISRREQLERLGGEAGGLGCPGK